MNNVKSCKIKLISLIALLLLSVTLAITSLSPSSVYAASSVSPSNMAKYFETTSTAYFDEEGLYFNVKNNDAFGIKNKLAIDDFSASIKVDSENIKSITLNLESDSYSLHGNKKVENEEIEFEKTIKNVIKINFEDNILSFNLNEKEAVTGIALTDNLDIGLKVVNGILTVSVEDVSDVNTDDYYKIAHKAGCAIAKLSFSFELKENKTQATNIFKSIDQRASITTSSEDGKYKQNFAIENGSFKSIALPRIALNEKIFNNEGKISVKSNTEYALNYKTYCVFNNYTAADYNITTSDSVKLNKDKTKITFTSRTPDATTPDTTVCEITNGEDENKVVIASYPVEIRTKSTTNNVPIYKDATTNEDIILAYKDAVKKAALKDYNGVEASIRLGDTYTVPSLENLVVDSTAYANLTHILYYSTPNKDTGSSSGWTINIDGAGDYMFYVAFGDDMGEDMKKEDFVVVDEEDPNVVSYGKYGAYVFTFHVEDNAPMSVTAAAQGKGYLRTSYTASAFKIEASGYNANYTLFYNSDLQATKDSDGWVEIPKVADIDEDYNQNGWTYEQIKALDYNGLLRFTPNKIGSYKIDCVVTSTSSVRSASDSTVIRVEGAPVIVEVPNNWLRDNLASVVFLSIGTFCLIGIVILLCIKPKNSFDNDED